MRKKLACIFVIFIFSAITILSGYRDVIFKPDYSDVELVYENDEKNRYYYDKLTENGKIAYTLILPELSNHTERIEVPELSQAEFDDVTQALYYDNPEIFCIGFSSRLKSEGRIVYFYPTYVHSSDECQSKKQEFENAVNKALSGIKSNFSDYEKELYIHDYICKVCVYEKDADGSKYSSAYDVFVSQKAVCEGYAKAAKLLLDRLSVSNYLIIGDSKDENGETVGHMWNIVNLDGNNYHLDITWDDTDSDNPGFNHVYFNVDDEMIQKTHFNLSPSENNCNSMALNYCNVNGMRFSKYDNTAKKVISRDIYDKYRQKINVCQFAFTDEKEYKLAVKKISDGDDLSEMINDIRRTYGKVNYTSVEYITDESLYTFVLIFT